MADPFGVSVLAARDDADNTFASLLHWSGPAEALRLRSAGFGTLRAVRGATPEELLAVDTAPDLVARCAASVDTGTPLPLLKRQRADHPVIRTSPEESGRGVLWRFRVGLTLSRFACQQT